MTWDEMMEGIRTLAANVIPQPPPGNYTITASGYCWING